MPLLVSLVLIKLATSLAGSPSIDITRQDGSQSTFMLRSLELDVGFNQSLHCDARGNSLGYSPNRRPPEPAMVNNLVVLAGNGVSGVLNRLKGTRWASFEAIFLARMNHSHILISIEGAEDDSLVSELQLKPVACVRYGSAGLPCGNRVAFTRDETYHVYEALHGSAFIFVGFRSVRVPWQFMTADGGLNNRLIAEARKGVGKIKSNAHQDIYDYARMTSWYSHFVFVDHAALLGYFDYFQKVDVDVCFGAAGFFPRDYTVDMAEAGALFLHRGVRHDNPSVVQNLDNCIASYVDLQSSMCGRKVNGAAHRSKLGASYLADHTFCFFGEYIGGWLGLFTSPEVLRYGHFWSNFHSGIYQHRWTDQQFFLHAVALFGSVDGNALYDVTRFYDKAWFHRCTGKCAPMFQKKSNKGGAPC